MAVLPTPNSQDLTPLLMKLVSSVDEALFPGDQPRAHMTQEAWKQRYLYLAKFYDRSTLLCLVPALHHMVGSSLKHCRKCSWKHRWGFAPAQTQESALEDLVWWRHWSEIFQEVLDDSSRRVCPLHHFYSQSDAERCSVGDFGCAFEEICVNSNYFQNVCREGYSPGIKPTS